MHAQSTEPNETAELITLEAEPSPSARENLLSGLKPILEAAILASHQPLTIEQMSELFDEAVRPTHNDLAQCLESLSADCESRGVELIEVASGFRFQVKASVYQYVGRLWTERQSKYSRALLETLSLIAYRQPITRPEIEGVRGVAVSSQIIRTLEEREWIRVVGHREVPGRPALFGTTRAFLDYFKLKSLEDLPTLSEIKDLDDLAPEFDFSGTSNAPIRVSLEQDPAQDALESAEQTPSGEQSQPSETSVDRANKSLSDSEEFGADTSLSVDGSSDQANEESDDAELTPSEFGEQPIHQADTTSTALESSKPYVDQADNNHDENLP
jgi:segregation and condensation protein B